MGKIVETETTKEQQKGEFKDMCRHVKQLNHMLNEDEHYWGLSSWCQFYAEHMKAISDYWKNN